MMLDEMFRLTLGLDETAELGTWNVHYLDRQNGVSSVINRLEYRLQPGQTG